MRGYNKIQSFSAGLFFLLITTAASGQSIAAIKADSTINNKAVYLFYKKKNDTLYSGSGMVVKYKEQYFIVTAAHNTDNMVFESLSVYFTADNSVRVLPIIYFAKDSASSLRTSKDYDLSVIKLTIAGASKRMIDQVTIPADHIERKSGKIRKGMVVLGLGYVDYKGQNIMDLTPVEQIDSTTIDSEIIKFKRFDNHLPSHFFVLNKIANRGMSGGPVFSNIDRDDWASAYRVIGIFHGQLLNDDGKFYTFITPLKDVFRLFGSY